ncbi:peptidylprolyl isomerase [bacterium]|nr:peptidylprolyl isomerase [bacterium]
MTRLKWLLPLLALFILACGTPKEEVCVLETSMGTMTFKFYNEDAPNTSTHFKQLVTEGYYNGLDFYRVVKGHVIQCGDSSVAVDAEFNHNPHIEGTVGLARGDDPNSGQAAFFICLAPRPHLDGRYTVFGQLIDGIDVLRAIGNTEVNEKYFGEAKIAFHEPKVPVIIVEARIEQRKLK